MNDYSIQNAKTHNIALGIITVACIGAVLESITQGWEFWVPPLILIGVIIAWSFHVSQYGSRLFRENYYLFFSLLVAFYHGVHATSLFDLIVVSALMLVTCALLRRRDFMILGMIEFFVLIFMLLFISVRTGTFVFDSLNISRLALHIIAEICLFRALSEVISAGIRDDQELERRNSEKEAEKVDMEDFLVNISHELRTPVNVIGGLSSLILKKEDSDDVRAIQNAGRRLSHQIEDIQDYSEIQRGDVVLEEEKYMITSVLNDIIEEYGFVEKRGNLDLVIDLDPSVPAVMQGDSGKISKIIKHLLSNGFKFTRNGGVYLRIYTINREYGVNLVIEATDTGIGMTSSDIEKLSKGMFQSNKKRNRSTGGIGLGLPIVYGFVRKMNGFVTIESERKKGTTVRISIAQQIIDPSPCICVKSDKFINIAFHVIPEKYTVSRVRDFYRNMATDMAAGLRLNLYSASTLRDLKRLVQTGNITHVFMGDYEYEAEPEYFDELADGDVTVAVSADPGFAVRAGSKVIIMPKPLYGYPVARILNGDGDAVQMAGGEFDRRPELDGLRALVVDDEPMNLVVATGLFKDYNMTVDTAESGRSAIEKYKENDYDIIFMDHMMPEMDGVEAMKHIRNLAADDDREVIMIALTANAISGAREMFLQEGFDGFVSKPISIPEFERTMNRVISGRKGGRS